MSEDKVLGVCPSCGAQNPKEFLFCSACGTKLNKDNNSENRDNAAPRATKKAQNARATVEKVSSWTSAFSNRLVLRSVTLAVAIVLFVFSFLPFGASTVEINGEKYTVSYNTVDAIDLAIATLSFKTDVELMTSDEYYELEKIMSGEESEAAVQRYLMLSHKLSLMRAKSGVRISAIVSGLASLLYLVIVTVYLVYSAIAFALELIAHVKGSRSPKKYFVNATRYLWLSVLLLPAMGFALFGSAPALCESGFGWALIVSMIIGVLASVFVSIDPFMHRDRRGESERRTRRSVISLLLIVIIIISLCLPVMTMKFTSVSDGNISESSMYLDLADYPEFSADDVQSFANRKSSSAKKLLITTANELASGDFDGSYSETYLFNTLVMSYARCDFSVLHTVIFTLYVAILLFAAFLLWNVLRRTLLGGEASGGIKPLKVLLFLFAIAGAIVVFVYSLMADGCAVGTVGATVDIDLGIGPIFMIIFCVALMLTLDTKAKETNKGEYDNADVSYAPYVIE